MQTLSSFDPDPKGENALASCQGSQKQQNSVSKVEIRMNKTQAKTAKRASRHNRIRAKVSGTAARPRLAVFRSNKFLYAQLIDDEAAKTLGAADTRKAKGTSAGDRATEIANSIAEQAKKLGAESVVFDRGGFPYKGTIATFADAAREAGLKF